MCEVDPNWKVLNSFRSTVEGEISYLQAVAQAARTRLVEIQQAKADWTLGTHKSPTTWNNRMLKRQWTNEQIDQAIRHGKQFEAPNFVNPRNRAIRYEHNGKFVVRDEVTKEILQISKPMDFKPREIP